MKFHWDREGTSTTWLRVAQPYSGGPDGLWLPDVNDEVLVGFEHGDPDRPYVIARLWNPDDAPPERRSIEFEDLTRPWPS